ncbi:hypothetical protein ACJJTC_019051 [Scirpophaga incertulas]
MDRRFKGRRGVGGGGEGVAPPPSHPQPAEPHSYGDIHINNGMQNCERYPRSWEVQQTQSLRTIAQAPRYVRNDVLRRDLRCPSLLEYTKMLARKMYERAAKSQHPLIQNIAPQHTRPPEGRIRRLPRDLIEEEEE